VGIAQTISTNINVMQFINYLHISLDDIIRTNTHVLLDFSASLICVPTSKVKAAVIIYVLFL